jgi:outer membrane protein TolC
MGTGQRTPRRRAILLLLVGSISGPAAGEPLALETVLRSAAAYYPQVLAAREAARARASGALATEGAFDLRVDQVGQVRASGFYDGRTLDTRLVKPLPAFGAQIYGGYKLSDGQFPVYENEFDTLSGGEFSVGAILSLWRDREIDQRRFDLARSRNEVRKAELELLLRQILVQREAAGAYLQWLAAGRELQVYQELLRLADLRQTQFADLVREGALAQITLTENLQAVLRRRALVADAERLLVNRANFLSLYLRNPDGSPRVPSADELPADFPRLPPVDAAAIEAAVAAALELRPDAALLAVDGQVEADRVRLGENLLKPRVDVGITAARDVGSGSNTLDGTETVVKLQVSIPVERRTGEGRRAEAQANLNRIRQEQRLIEDRIAAEIRNVGNDIVANERLMKITADELTQATTMEAAERERLEAGQSNFFLLNAREETSADVRVRHIRAEQVYGQSLADFYAATVQWELILPDAFRLPPPTGALPAATGP